MSCVWLVQCELRLSHGRACFILRELPTLLIRLFRLFPCCWCTIDWQLVLFLYRLGFDFRPSDRIKDFAGGNIYHVFSLDFAHIEQWCGLCQFAPLPPNVEVWWHFSGGLLVQLFSFLLFLFIMKGVQLLFLYLSLGHVVFRKHDLFNCTFIIWFEIVRCRLQSVKPVAASISLWNRLFCFLDVL